MDHEVLQLEEPAAPPTTNKILCCECGVLIEPNPSNMCVACLRNHVDITEGIPKQITLHFCRGCERYLQPPSEWVACTLESRELLGLCLKKLKGLQKIKLIDAGFIWTEPHSKRIKVKLTVQSEVIGGTIIQQVFVVDYTVENLMCDACHRTEAQDFWRAIVQVRQKCENKKTFYYLEQLILKHRAHENTLGIKPSVEGLDFFYATENHARKMVDFLQSVLPIKYQHSKKLLSHDIFSNIYNYKFTYCVDIVPLSRESIICLPKKLTHQLGSITSLCLVNRVTNSIHLIDPCSAQIAEVSASVYWRNPFLAVVNPKQLVEYIVMDLEVIKEKDLKKFPGQGMVSNKHVVADAWVVKASDLGTADRTIHTRTHLGHVLKTGDSVLGYNIQDSNINDPNYDKLDSSTIADVILVKKYYGDKQTRKRARNWQLKHMAGDNMPLDRMDDDFDEFLDDLEEDPGLRKNVNIFKASHAVDYDDVDFDPSMPKITLEEMLDDLTIEDVDMAE
ncbi:60S ribosomal export protein NMD3 [Arctopsyche grandis]|uniref:60S ribosomal export protein NMD3 n=1 Tax=Arctopsyche grandis TaxID=121162 RepID=UPI00406D7E9F